MKLRIEWVACFARQLACLAVCLVPLTASGVTAPEAPGIADTAGAAATDWVAGPSPLLAIDQNRATVVDRIVREWGQSLASSSAGIDAEQLRELLSSMRADQLLAASLAGSLEGLRNVVSAAIVERSAKPPLAKALGDPGLDVVYTPVTPCRLVDTRSAFPAVYQAGGVFAPAEIRSYTVQGGNGQCLTQLPAGLDPAALQIQVFGIPTNGASGDIEVLPQGSAFGLTATLVVIGNIPFTSGSTATRVNQTGNQISVQVRSGVMHVAIDVVGYFVRPQATALDCTSITQNGAGNIIQNNDWIVISIPQCAAGRTRTGGGCHSYAGVGQLISASPFAIGTCMWRNDTGASVNDNAFGAEARCCRVPGR